MHTSGWISALVAVLVPGLTVALSTATRGIEAGPIAALVTQLGSPKHQEREAATRALDELGAPGLPALRSATQSEDAEIRRRAEDLVLRIDRRVAAAKLLEPKRIRLSYKDTPVPAAVRDLAQRTGYPIQLQADPVRMANRKITLETGDLPFWEALDLFCQKAGLGERDLLPSARPSLQVADGAGRVAQPIYETTSSSNTRWVLVDGQAPVLPGYRSSSVRVLALPTSLPGRDRVRTAGECALTLDVVAEAKIQWQSILEVRIDRALDEQGQHLTQVGAGSAHPAGAALLPGMANGVMLWDAESGLPVSSPRRLPIRLKWGAAPGKMLTEVTGTIAAQVQTPPQPLITVDNVLQTVGHTYRGDGGEALKLADVIRQPDGSVRLRVEIEQPLPGPVLGGGAALVRGNQVIAMNGRPRGLMFRDVIVGGPPNLTLLDAVGQKIPLEVTESEMTAGGAGMTQRLLVGYRRLEGQPEASKLVFHGRRSLLLEVPFTLKDVPVQ